MALMTSTRGSILKARMNEAPGVVSTKGRPVPPR